MILTRAALRDDLRQVLQETLLSEASKHSLQEHRTMIRDEFDHFIQKSGLLKDLQKCSVLGNPQGNRLVAVETAKCTEKDQICRGGPSSPKFSDDAAPCSPCTVETLEPPQSPMSCDQPQSVAAAGSNAADVITTEEVHESLSPQTWPGVCSDPQHMAELLEAKPYPVVGSKLLESSTGLGDIGVYSASRQSVTSCFDSVLSVPGSVDHDSNLSSTGPITSESYMPSALPTLVSASTMEFAPAPERGIWDGNFPNDLRLPAAFRVADSGSRVSSKCSLRRASLRNRCRNSGSGWATSGDSISVGRRNSVESHKSAHSDHTFASTVSLPIEVRRPSFLSTRLDFENSHDDLQIFGGVEKLVYHPYFDITIAGLIILNGLSIGVQTDCMARAVTEKVPWALRLTELFFCAVFSVELILRIIAEGCYFFIGAEWGWNMFDCCVVVLQLFEEIMGAIASATDSDPDGSRTNFSFMRVLRILRLIRIVRIVRVLRFIGELRTIVTSIASSMKHLLWTVMLLLLMIYTIAVYFTQLVLDHRLGNSDTELSNLITPWGSLGRSSLTLFGAISGGIDWEAAVVPLVQHISVLLAPLFCLYIAFAILALMNVVTGVFVENAIDSANRDKERYLVQTVRELFEKADLDQTGVISWTEFESQLSNPELKTLLYGLGIDQVSAKGLFKLLDIDNSGSIDADELLTGTLRLRGEARSIDLAALIYESRRTSRRIQQALAKLSHQLAEMISGSQRRSHTVDTSK